jgi:intein/homing endonuclease
MRKKVKKEKFKLKTKSGKVLELTNDHTLIVFRDGEKINIKPSE